MTHKGRTIQGRLMTVILSTSAIVLLLTCLAFSAYEFISFRHTTTKHLSMIGEIIAANSTAALAFNAPKDAEEVLRSLIAEKEIVAAALYDNTGNLFARFIADTLRIPLPVTPEQPGYRFLNGHLIGYQPVKQGEAQLGTLYLESDMSAIYERLLLYGKIALMVIVLSFLTAFLLSRHLQKRISGPILSLAQTAKDVSDRRDYSVRATKHTVDELGHLTDVFNNMLAQIEEQNIEIVAFNQKLEHKILERTIELKREINERIKAEEKTQILNAELEVKVLERTQALATLNKELERRVIERTSELTQALTREKESNATKTRFVSMASHEFRTPLSAILSSVSLIATYNKSGHEANISKHVERIKSSSRNLISILDDLLCIDKVERGSIRVHKELFDLTVLSKDLIEEMNGMLKNGQRIIFTHQGDRLIFQDKKILTNVLLNLLSNAVKYSGENTNILLKSEVTDQAICIKVKDEGIGIPEEEQAELFKQFYRAKNVGNIHGTGLGLNIVKNYLDLLGGTIAFKSKRDHGSSFTVKFMEQVAHE